jgi:hypothetical protein
MIGTVRKQVKLCTNCIKLMRKIQKEALAALTPVVETVA